MRVRLGFRAGGPGASSSLLAARCPACSRWLQQGAEDSRDCCEPALSAPRDTPRKKVSLTQAAKLVSNAPTQCGCRGRPALGHDDEQQTRKLTQVLAQVRRDLKETSLPSVTEASTVTFFVLPVLQALGWNGPVSIVQEYQVPGGIVVDIALCSGGKPLVFVEAKRVGTQLSDKDAAQVLAQGSAAGVRWCLLTNGREYRLYDQDLSVPLEDKLVFAADLTQDDEQEVVSRLSILARDNVEKGIIAEKAPVYYYADRLAAWLRDRDSRLITALRGAFPPEVTKAYDDEPLSEALRPVRVTGPAPPPGPGPESPPALPRELADYLNRVGAPAEVAALVGQLHGQLMALPGTTLAVRKVYAAYKVGGRNFCEIEAQKEKVKIFIDGPVSGLQDPQGLARDVSAIGHWGTGNYEVSLTPGAELEPVVQLVRQGHELRQPK